MRLRLLFTLALTSALFAGAASSEYDFFDGARYPGGNKKPGVDIYKVKQAGGPFAEGYQRREVKWWPRKGVDIIEVKQGMLLRTWTLRDRQFDPNSTVVHPTVGVAELTRRLSSSQPRSFEAHLIGFRGVGNRYGTGFGYPEYYCPAVVLRFGDGTKRCFTRGSFVAEDEKFILDLYVKEMEELRTTLPKLKYGLDQKTRDLYSDTIKPGEPGRMRLESEHFVWLSGSQHAPNEGYSPWINRDFPEKAALYRKGSVAFAEDMWAYQEHAGVLMPFWDRPERSKYKITVCGTYMDGYKWIGGYAGGGYGGCGIKHAGGGPWSMGLAHEWGHGVPLQLKYGGGEILADACQTLDDPAVTWKFSNNVDCPWRNCVHASYSTGMFYGMMGDDPNWGYAMVITMPVGKKEGSVFHTLARVGEQRGLFENGIRGVGDMIGEFAARQAELDCELRDGIRRAFVSVKRNWLESVDRKSGLYRIPWAEAPEPFGANIIRLVPEKDVKQVTVDFRGFYDPATYGDWRVCIVAVDKTGKVRYSGLWNKGAMEMEVKPGDRRFWLTVAATPWALPPGERGVDRLLTGRHAYRYPYELKLSGCRPGTPHNLPGDTDDYEMVHIEGSLSRYRGRNFCMIPHPGDTAAAEIMRETLPALRSELKKFGEETDRLAAAGKISTDHWWYRSRFVPHMSFLDRCSGWMLDGLDGRRHPNGGGWVANSAQVAATAYVAPDAMVLDGAKVLDHAALEDFAVVRGSNVVVSGHARLGGQACVAGNVQIGGYTRVRHPIISEEDEPVVPNEVPLREKQVEGEGGGLWAYYACDREEAEVFEDFFRYEQPGGARRFYRVIHNGHLYGEPEFIVDGDHRGFQFNGKSQYAEASPILADLGQITIEMALKWGGGKGQAVFDFGTSVDNRLVLTPDGASGKAELAVTLNGKTDRVVADATLPRDKWADCRVEIDGKEIVLWIDGRKAAEKQSAFRPADVYPAGLEKRNFIAASRDGAMKFRGSLDYLRVWHTVYEDFTKAPRPRRHSPRRVDRDFIASCKNEYAGASDAIKRRQALIQAKMEENPEMLAYYKDLGAKIEPMKKAIENQESPALTDAKRKVEELRKALEERRRELNAEYAELPEATRKQTKQRDYVDKRTVELKRKLDKAQVPVRIAVKENIAQHAPEHNWLHNVSWVVNSGHYNYPYRSYIKDEATRKVGIKVQLCHESFGTLEQLCEAQTETEWYKRCDWDWRLGQEIDDSIKDLPELQKWLERARGDLEGDRPDGAR